MYLVPLINGFSAVAAVAVQVAVQREQYKRLRPLVALPELWWGSKQILGMPKGGLLLIHYLKMPLNRLLIFLEWISMATKDAE
jgi:hypothetical protein